MAEGVLIPNQLRGLGRELGHELLPYGYHSPDDTSATFSEFDELEKQNLHCRKSGSMYSTCFSVTT